MAVAQTNLEAKFVRRALEKDGGKSGARERGGRAREFLPSALLSFPPPNFPRFFQTPATRPRRLQAFGTDSSQSSSYRARREQRLPFSHHTLRVTRAKFNGDNWRRVSI